MDSSKNLTNEKEEDTLKQEDVLMKIPKRIERRNAVVLEPEDLAAILPKLSKTQQKELT